MKASKLVEILDLAITQFGDRPVKIFMADDMADVHGISVPTHGDAREAIVICDKDSMEVLS